MLTKISTHITDWQWSREIPFQQRATRVEAWRCQRSDGTSRIYQVETRIGKPFDVIGLKGGDLGETRAYAAFLAASAKRLYAAAESQETVRACPACGGDIANAIEAFRIFDVPYCRCESCGHGFVRTRPSKDALKELFSSSEEHSSAYLDREAAERRLHAIIAPKLDWVLDVYAGAIGGKPASVIDVGAGGGHFVAGASRAGIAAEGWELSAPSRGFAKSVFGLDLRGGDFTAEGGGADLITFWGLLEYVPEPHALLNAARKRLSAEEGLLIVEVPRFDALGTIVQACNPSGVARHMDPTSHINCFSDSSLMTALAQCGFEPVAAWYFGMDAYEMLVQVALRSGHDEVLEKCADMIPALQAGIDAGLQCDDLIVAARPAGSGA
jgi:2-polyprenyl-3-methyl-5-hydroxy-6-metoxy-1,4-benzoquinol methylase